MEDGNLSLILDSDGGENSHNSPEQMGTDENEYIFDKPYVQIIFICLYSLVFCLCFFGNLAVVLVVTLHCRMRSITKFCLGNLAFANLCVGIFCVYQNLSTYLMDRWVFGPFMCKMYHFINCLSYTASVLILVVMCVERYLAILYPLKFRRMLTITKLRILIITVWFLSAILSSPRLYYITTYSIPATTLGEERETVEICAPQRNLYDTLTADMIYFIVLFIFPISVMTILYTRMGIHLWHSVRAPVKVSTLNYSGSLNTTNMSESEYLCKNPRNRYETRLKRAGKKHIRSVPSSPTSIEISQVSPKEGNIQYDSPSLRRHKSERAPSSDDVFNENSPDDFNKRSGAMKGTKTYEKNLTRFESPSALRFQVSLEYKTEENSLILPNGTPSRGQHSPNRNCGLLEVCDEEHRAESGENSAKTSAAQMSPKRRPKVGNCVQIRGAKLNVPGNAEKFLNSRRSVVRMLIAIVITFALCNLPFHLRKICQNYDPNYDFSSHFSNILTPLTFLFMYTNCAINPILYAFMSKSFRAGFLDVTRCKLH